MIVFIVLSIVFVLQIIFKIVFKNNLKKFNTELNECFDAYHNIPQFRKYNILSLLFSIIVNILIFTLPVTLNVLFYIHFPIEMIVGKLNILFTFVLSFFIIILLNHFQYKIFNYFIKEVNEKRNNEQEELPSINLVHIFISDLLNVITTSFIYFFVLVLYFIL